MFAHRGMHLPLAIQALGEGHVIAGQDVHGLVRGGNGDLAFQDVAGFLLVVMPGKGRGLALPDRPLFEAQRLAFFGESFSMVMGMGSPWSMFTGWLLLTDSRGLSLCQFIRPLAVR